MVNTTGALPGQVGTGKWEPTVVYLFGLLVVEWLAFMMLTKYL